MSRPLSLNFWQAISIVVLAMLLRTASAQEKIAPQTRVGEPWALSVSPDGRKVAAARGFQDAGGALIVWDLVDGKQTVVAEHKSGLLGAAFSPDGRRLAAGGFEGVLRIYDAASGKLLHQFTGNKAPINGVVWSPNGKLVATAGLDTTVRLWDLDDDRELHTFRGHPEWVLAVAYSPDGKWIVSACKDGTLKVWDVEGKKERLTLKGHGQGVQSVAVSPDGKWIASGAWGKDVRIWDASSGVAKHILKGQNNGVFSVRFTPDSKILVSTSGAYNVPSGVSEIRFWDVETGKDLATLFGHVGGIWCCAFSPDGRTLFTGGADQTIKVWEVATLRQRLTIPTLGKPEPAKASTAALTPADLEQIGRQLAAADSRQAYAGIQRLVRAGASGVPWLCQLLQPVDAARQKQMRRWVAELENDDAAARAETARRLEEGGPAALTLLRLVAADAAIPLLRERAAELLKKLAPGGGVSETVHLGRALEALEMIGNTAALAHLGFLAKGPADSLLVREARDALKRLERHTEPP